MRQRMSTSALLALTTLSIAALVGCGSDSASGAGTGGAGGEATGVGGAGNGAQGSGAQGSGAGAPSSGRGGAGNEGSGGEAPSCGVATTPCSGEDECCAELECGNTSLGQVCCGQEGIACNTPNGEDCCGNLECVDGTCGYDIDVPACGSPCKAPPALALEKKRLEQIGGSFLGICGDANHTYGFHVPAANLPSSDYSLEGAANDPVCDWYASAIDIGMDWPASRDWLKWLIQGIINGDIENVTEVIGSYDGQDVRYWSDDSGWTTNGIDYSGSGHDTWTHVSIYRSKALEDAGILLGWSADGGP
jgi:hypothetical protein